MLTKDKQIAVFAVLLLILTGGVCLLLMTRDHSRLTLADFEFLEPGMSLETIVARVGEPDRDVGSGFYIPVYELADGSTIVLQFGGDPSELLMAIQESEEGTVTVIVEQQEQ